MFLLLVKVILIRSGNVAGFMKKIASFKDCPVFDQGWAAYNYGLNTR